MYTYYFTCIYIYIIYTSICIHTADTRKSRARGVGISSGRRLNAASAVSSPVGRGNIAKAHVRPYRHSPLPPPAPPPPPPAGLSVKTPVAVCVFPRSFHPPSPQELAEERRNRKIKICWKNWNRLQIDWSRRAHGSPRPASEKCPLTSRRRPASANRQTVVSLFARHDACFRRI